MINKTAFNALNTVVFMAAQGPQALFTAQALSRGVGRSVSSLEAVLSALKAQGLVKSSRGPGGGYALARSSAEVVAWDVLSVFLPADALADLEATDGGLCIAELERRYRDEFIAFMKSVTLDSLTVASLDQWVQIGAQGGLSRRPAIQPLPPRARMDAPNSVFDLSRFMALTPA